MHEPYLVSQNSPVKLLPMGQVEILAVLTDLLSTSTTGDMSQRLKWSQHIAHPCLQSTADIQTVLHTVWMSASTFPKNFCGKAFHAVGKPHLNVYVPVHVHKTHALHTVLLTKFMFTAGWVTSELNWLLYSYLFFLVMQWLQKIITE